MDNKQKPATDVEDLSSRINFHGHFSCVSLSALSNCARSHSLHLTRNLLQEPVISNTKEHTSTLPCQKARAEKDLTGKKNNSYSLQVIPTKDAYRKGVCERRYQEGRETT
ncbi:hypothetical protein RDI58_014639 [Solanum bulbocastanum]|uniref:Uncharacterized protein n=1 Tax=Solanum bulbocastanum TaxID=147425 RepID=A0AAN8YAS4_SOLBU